MKAFPLYALLLSAALAIACNGEDGPNNGGKNSQNDIWAHAKPLVSKVEVSSEGSLIESYEYTYDEQGRILTLVKTDRISGDELLNLRYTYPSENEMRATGRIFPLTSNRYITAIYDPKAGTLVFNGSWADAEKYALTLDSNGLVNRVESQSNFAAKDGSYNSDLYYSEEYSASGGTITTSVIGTDLKAKSRRTTHIASSSALTTAYTYTSQEDRQNLAAYLMPCYFPVWIAAGLPGNQKLIKGISSKTGDNPAPETVSLDYSLNASGDIDTATRTDSNAGTPILVRTYKFYYL